MELMFAGGLGLIILFVVAVVVSTVAGTVGSGIIDEEDSEED
ncbi:MAG: hypothetical protein PHV18_10345 [Lachnospiraceae bacterium]|nr:hypothetical protein [Lachnospiraceae bacterium]